MDRWFCGIEGDRRGNGFFAGGLAIILESDVVVDKLYCCEVRRFPALLDILFFRKNKKKQKKQYYSCKDYKMTEVGGCGTQPTLG